MDRWILIRRIRGPVYILTVGIVALLAEWTRFGWNRTWPIFIIVAGVLMFAERNAMASANASGEFPGRPPEYPQGPGTEIISQPPPVSQPPQYPTNEPR
jgi:hypothetical protein